MWDYSQGMWSEHEVLKEIGGEGYVCESHRGPHSSYVSGSLDPSAAP